MGTELFSGSGEMLWPPKPLETQFGYRRVDKLRGEDVRPGGIIEKVACVDFYGSLIQQFRDLGYGSDGRDQLLLFPYDWRLDLEKTAAALANRLDDAEAAGADEISLVAHSMGGLVTRLVLESGRFAERPWYKKIRQFIAIATPHQGAPLALARVLGLDSALGISAADFRKLSNDPRYPSGYQLLPAPSEEACWDHGSLSVGVVDIYDNAIAQKLGLEPALLARARFVHDILSRNDRPRHIRYFYFGATGHETVTRVNVMKVGDEYPIAEMIATRTEDGGDGTVPFWSALSRAGQKQVVVNEHSQAFRGLPFKRVFYRLLGGDLGPPLQAMSADDQAALLQADVEGLRLSLATPIIPSGLDFELLVVPVAPLAMIQGEFVLRRLDDDGQPLPQGEEVLSEIAYRGPATSRLRLQMPAIAIPGPYELQFVGQPRSSMAVRFAVAAPALQSAG
jgi:hypothetical protein